MSDLPSYDLELKAAEERQHLHFSIEELKSRLRDSLDVKKSARDHLLGACAVVAALGLATGYAFTGIFLHE
jgi:hypothetical protein